MLVTASPLGSGQAVVRGKQAASPAANGGVAAQASTRHSSRSKRRRLISRQPQVPTGITTVKAARPKSCIARSAKIAPGTPMTLVTGALVAWLRLGSFTDQVASAPVASTAEPISSNPSA